MKIEITRYKVYGRVFEGQIMEQTKTIDNKYYEEEANKSELPSALSDQRRLFIDKVVKKISDINRTNEVMFKADPSKPFFKLVITNVS